MTDIFKGWAEPIRVKNQVATVATNERALTAAARELHRKRFCRLKDLRKEEGFGSSLGCPERGA